jgi:hypothetical protein
MEREELLAERARLVGVLDGPLNEDTHRPGVDDSDGPSEPTTGVSTDHARAKLERRVEEVSRQLDNLAY